MSSAEITLVQKNELKIPEKEMKKRFFLVGEPNNDIQEFESGEALDKEKAKRKIAGHRAYQIDGDHPAINTLGNESGDTIAEAFDDGKLFFDDDLESGGYAQVFFSEDWNEEIRYRKTPKVVVGDISPSEKVRAAEVMPSDEELLGKATMEKMAKASEEM